MWFSELPAFQLPNCTFPVSGDGRQTLMDIIFSYFFRRSLDEVSKFKYVATNKTGKAMENARLINVCKSLELLSCYILS